jgi:hypothetical protein
VTRTTRPARTPTTPQQARPKRVAPRYPQLKPDMYAQLDRLEQRRHDLHADLDAILDAQPAAQLDRDAVGFPNTYRARDGSRSTDEGALNAVELASQHPSPAPDWLTEAVETTAAITRVGRLARYHWPPALTVGTVVATIEGSVTVGQRGNQTPTCAWCGDPAPSGRHPATGQTLVKRCGDHTLHSPTCYIAAYRRAGKAKVTMAAIVTARLTERKVAS